MCGTEGMGNPLNLFLNFAEPKIVLKNKVLILKKQINEKNI